MGEERIAAVPAVSNTQMVDELAVLVVGRLPCRQTLRFGDRLADEAAQTVPREFTAIATIRTFEAST